MKKILTLSAALMLCASMAMAQGVNLAVGDCGGFSTTHAVTNACTSNSGAAFVAFGSAVVPPVTKSAFVGAMSVIDVQTSLANIPDWWRADGCRGSAAYGLVTDGTMGGTCATLWDNVAPAGNNITAVPFVGGPARVRFLLGAVLSATDAYDFIGDGSSELSVFKWTVLRTKSVNTGLCAGCATGACVVLNEVQLQGLNDHSADEYIHITNPLQSNAITYNAGAPSCSGSTPTQNRTWGSVKALYR